MPEKIEWERAESGDPELEKIKYSSFYTLSFKGSEFILLGSNNSPGRDDSLMLTSEPGYSLFYGKWELRDSLVIINYRKVYGFLNLPGDTMIKEQTDTLLLRKESLIFNNENYKQHSKIDTNIINRFWQQAAEVE